MYFGEKLKRLRLEQHLTQEELASKLFVTRTAVSKWETGKGFPAIDSLKAIADLFDTTIDDLISDSESELQRLRDQRRANIMYWIAIGFFGVTVGFALCAKFFNLPHLFIGSLAGAAGYLIFAVLSKPRYIREEQKKHLLLYILSRAVPAAVFLFVAVTVFLQLDF